MTLCAVGTMSLTRLSTMDVGHLVDAGVVARCPWHQRAYLPGAWLAAASCRPWPLDRGSCALTWPPCCGASASQWRTTPPTEAAERAGYIQGAALIVPGGSSKCSGGGARPREQPHYLTQTEK